MKSKFLKPQTSPMDAVDLTINNSVHFNTGPSIDQTGYRTSFVPETQNCNSRRSATQNSQIYKEYPVFCPDCGKGLACLYSLNRHCKSASACRKKKPRNITGEFKCNICNNGYKSSGSLSRHRRYECRVFPQFFCIFCNKRFTQQSSLSRHLMNKHPEEDANNTVDKFVKVPQLSYIESNNLHKRDRRKQYPEHLK
ncbi:hypothetical protein ALC56_13441 [Trachymyrmex septentrionalis]|uniref:C2H2-type domain-containing protein n=2 Tax=Trachymyrmex septentrionalis TaxID=34720 RepID=A0A195EVZ7_9HYME|nr:hypothetical protein ALC56_13441 [Trachymyrmex septentrionalis]